MGRDRGARSDQIERRQLTVSGAGGNPGGWSNTLRAHADLRC